jgi:hypothetical protein
MKRVKKALTKRNKLYSDKNVIPAKAGIQSSGSQIKSGMTDTISSILLFVFILLLPTQFGKHFFFPFSYLSGVRVDYLAPTVYLTDMIVGLLVLIDIKSVFAFLKQKKILLLLTLLFINVMFSQSFPISIYRYIKIVELLIVGFIAYKDFVKEKMLLIGFFAAGTIQLLLALLQLISKHSIQGIFYFLGERYMNLSMPGIAKASFREVELLRPYGTFSHPNSLAGFFLLLYSWVLIDKRFNRFLILKYISLFIFSLLIFISFSKIAIFVYLITNFYFLFFVLRINCQFCKWARFIILAVLSILFMQAQTDPLTLQKRLELLKNSVSIILRHPVTGVGVGSYLIVQNQFASKFFYFFNQPVHNIFLLAIAELGIPISLFIFYLLFSFLKKFRASSILLLASIFFTGFFDHYWLTLQQNMLLMGFVIGAILKRRG